MINGINIFQRVYTKKISYGVMRVFIGPYVFEARRFADQHGVTCFFITRVSTGATITSYDIMGGAVHMYGLSQRDDARKKDAIN